VISSNSGRCLWCHGADGDLVQVQLPGEAWQEEPRLVHPGHEERLRIFVDTARRRGQLFLALVVAEVLVLMNSTLVGVAVAQWVGLIIMGAALLAMAATIFVMPFATPQTARALGVRRSITLARGLGVGVGLLGLVLVVVAAGMIPG
jgi:hypothetical protein